MKTVFECAFAVEAHLVSHLLDDAGIANQVLGEYLQGAAGELPVGRLVRVVVPDENADAACALIAAWEQTAPLGFADPDDASSPADFSRRGSWLFWLAGLFVVVAMLTQFAARP
ncbi:MAG: DUF2007 domain-containing protein [Steroidobacteraceae bacterium]